MNSASHWDAAYDAGGADRSWHQDRAATSVELITDGGSIEDAIIDVGGGASVLVDDLRALGYQDITVIDISDAGLDAARKRLGAAASDVNWVVADLLHWDPERTYDVWHDRAVLHFLTAAQEQRRYLDSLLAATRPGARVVIGVFGPNGPTACSGLKVQRHSPASIAALLGEEFEITKSSVLTHITPNGSEQEFLWTVAQRI